MKKPTIISLFSGCGGMDIGFISAGFDVIWATDFNKHAVDTYKLNFPTTPVVQKNIKNISSSQIPAASGVIGGFPCQGFSVGGSRRVNDSRNTLYLEFCRIVRDKQPLFFVAENVKGLLTMGSGKVIEKIVGDFGRSNYNVRYALFNAKDFGVPQDRERVFLVGTRRDLSFSFQFPAPTHGSGLLPYVTLRDAIWDMQDNPGEFLEDGFSSRFMSRQRKRGWDEVAYCVQASAKQNALHPSGEKMVKISRDLWKFVGDNRRLSVEECKVIQSFHRNFKLSGNLIARYRLVGNAVPPKLAEAIAFQVCSSLP